MTDLLLLVAATLIGVLGGGVFFGGLWLTVRQLDLARQPALLLLGSLLVRLLLAGSAFYLVARLGDLLHLTLALAGFVLVRLLLLRRISPAAASQPVASSDSRAETPPVGEPAQGVRGQ